jgi:hypothetical protein
LAEEGGARNMPGVYARWPVPAFAERAFAPDADAQIAGHPSAEDAKTDGVAKAQFFLERQKKGR